MLRRINVSGFKSLDRFDLGFNQGLNIIVGPNGSGKTNIINFLEFLSYLSRHSLLEAVGRGGGAGRIFRRNSVGSLTKKISFTVVGNGEVVRFNYRRNQGEKQRAEYEYSADIQLSENNSTIYFNRQRLKIDLAPTPEINSKQSIDIEVLAIADDKVQTVFHRLDRSVISDAFLTHVQRDKSSLTEIKSAIEGFCVEYVRSRALYQLLERFVESIGLITRDLRGAQSFNISPAVVRTPEDIASEPEIAQDGRGLAAILFALTNARRGENLPYSYWGYRTRVFDNPEQMINTIISYSRLVSDSIENIYVAPDTVEAKLRIFLTVRVDNGTMSLPFSLVSDGTAKWFALVTAIMTSPSVFAIEEPENFLHPLMQKAIVDIVRTNFEAPEKQAFAVMTTHSETILNSVDPHDLILVHMEEGRTVASRPKNADDIRDEIRSTGFGAGYYYIAGAIE